MLKTGVDEDELEAEEQPRDEPGPKRPGVSSIIAAYAFASSAFLS
jgi:hypothetical protein